MIRKISALALALAMLLCLSGCGQSNAMTMVGLALSGAQQSDKTGELLQTALEESGRTVELAYAQSAEEQGDQLSNLMKDGASVLVVSPVDSVEVESLLGSGKDDVSNVKVVACGAPVASECVKAYIGPDLADAARQQAQAVIEELALEEVTPQQPYTVELIAGNGGTQALAAALEVLQPYADMGIITFPSGSDLESCHTTDAAGRITQLCRSTYAQQELDAVLCLGEGQSLQVISALKESYTGAAWPVVTGYGCDEEIVAALAQRMLNMTAYSEGLSPQELADKAVEAAFASEEEQKDTVLPCSTVKRGNYRKLLVKSGLYTDNKDGTFTKNA